MSLEGKKLRWFFNIRGKTADVVMEEDVIAKETEFNSVTLERSVTHIKCFIYVHINT